MTRTQTATARGLDTDHTIVPAGDLLALTEQKFPSGGEHYAIERVLAIAIPTGGDDYTAAYFIVGNGWTSDQHEDGRSRVVHVAAPADIRAVAIDWLTEMAADLGCLECCELRPWLTDDDLAALELVAISRRHLVNAPERR